MKHLKKLLMCTALVVFMSVSGVAECSYPTYTHSGGRYLTSFSLTDGSNTVQYYVGQTSTSNVSVYFDLTQSSTPLQTMAGSTLRFSELTWFGEWMHGYLYIDYDGDGTYDTLLNKDGDNGGELVSYSFYSSSGSGTGTNSAGDNVSNSIGLGQGTALVGASRMPEFTLPADLGSGLYKALFKVDWNSLEPCGNPEAGNGIGKNGGSATEFYIEVTGTEERTIEIESSDEGKGTVIFLDYDGTSVSASGVVTIIAVPNKGCYFINWTNKETGEKLSDSDIFDYKANAPIAIIGNFGGEAESVVSPIEDNAMFDVISDEPGKLGVNLTNDYIGEIVVNIYSVTGQCVNTLKANKHNTDINLSVDCAGVNGWLFVTVQCGSEILHSGKVSIK